MRFCAHCGAPLKEDAAFCPACGAPAEVPGGGTVQADPAQPATPADRPKPPAQPVYQTQTAPGHDRQAAPRSGLRRGPLAAGIVCLAAAILAFVKPAIIPYSLPVGIALAVLGVMFLVIASGKGSGAVIAVFLAVAILVPTVGEVSGLLPQDYKLIGIWRIVGESDLALIEFQRGNWTSSSDGEIMASGTWDFSDNILTLHSGLLYGGEIQLCYVTMIGDMLTLTDMEYNESVVLRRWS